MISDIVSFFVGPFAPPNPRKLGKVPDSSILLHRIRTGEVEVSGPEASFEGTAMLRQWIGYKWVYLNTSAPR
jgi:hypothetical protein